MTHEEADEFIANARIVLPRWQEEIAGLSGEDWDDACAARDSVLGTLRDLASAFPEKAAKIDALVIRFKQKFDG